MTGGSLFYSPKKVCQIIVACCMLHNLALRRQVLFLQEDGPDGGVVAAVEPVDSEDQEAEEEDIDNRNSVILQYFQGWGAGVVVLLRCLLSTSAGGGGGQFIVHASVRGPLLCHSVPPGVEDFLQHPYDGAQGGIDGSEFLPEAQILFLLQALGLLKLGQYRCHRLLGMVVGSHDVGEWVPLACPPPVTPQPSQFPCVPGPPSPGPAAVCTANGIPRLNDRRVDSCVVIVWVYLCWRDGVSFVFASLSLTFGVADLCGCLNFGGFRAVGHNDRGRILLQWRCVGGLLHGGKWLLPPML
ncbi:hypothetical protein NDU88_004170 [Pleurodeles waltl]|uniref:Nuclease HARBI1 n=1 Tax=Pleurodeles waltl TaxID=8319 RepID=A0AAV7WTC4_PLEWA|nr:hypothetical protein NDU88_004170 [Pleurodeles waltl]